MCLCLGFSDFSAKNNSTEIIGCKSLSRGLASRHSSIIIIGLLVNTGAEYSASVFDC